MSSTNRGYERHKTDYYVTPTQEISRFLIACKQYMPEVLNYQRIHDPCAGGDVAHGMSYPIALRQIMGGDVVITSSDIREDSLADNKGVDFLRADIKAQLFITNPPFYLAQEIIEKANNQVEHGGAVVMLLRLNFWGSQKRKTWLLKNMPTACFIHSKRMSFTEDGKTDSIEYAHFVWLKGESVEFTKTYLI